jgi:hypothetical protein
MPAFRARHSYDILFCCRHRRVWIMPEL